MCWSAQVAFLAFAAHVLTLTLVLHYKPLKYREISLFLTFYASMELLQFVQHLTLNLQDVHVLDTNCSYWNSFTTLIAWNLIWLQPLLFTRLAAGIDGRWKSKSWFALITYLVSIINIIFGFFSEPNYVLPNTNYGPVTCSGRGLNGHIQWTFAVKTVQYAPTYYTYLGLILMSILSFHPALLWTIGMGWLLTLAVSVSWVGVNPVLPSVWCYLSFLVDIPILIYIRHTWVRK